MKIIPAVLRAPPASAGPASALTDPAQSFEELLQAPAELRTARKARAFAYDEMGLIGASSRTAREAAVVPLGAAPVEEAPGAAVTAMEQDAPIKQLHDGANRDVMAQVEVTLAQRSTAHTPPPRKLSSAAVPARFPAQLPSEHDADEALGSRSAPHRQGQMNAGSRLSLSLVERHGALQVVAAAGGLEPEDRARLRKAIEAVAAQFGLALADFTLEGSNEPTSPLTTGAIHGDFRG